MKAGQVALKKQQSEAKRAVSEEIATSFKNQKRIKKVCRL